MPWKQSLVLAGLTAALVALPSAASAQDTSTTAPRREQMAPGRRMMGDPVGRLLSQRAELKLTDDQVRRLEAIRAKHDERRRPLVEKLQAERRALRDSAGAAPKADDAGEAPRPEHRRRMAALSPEAREAARALRETHRETAKEAMAVLTEEQREQLQRRMQERREERQERRKMRGEMRRGATGETR